VRAILLVEDEACDEKLTLRVLRRSNLANEIVVARDGSTALEYVFGTGAHSERDPAALPTLMLLDLKLPKIGGLEILRRIRADERTRELPIIVLTSSNEDEDVIRSYDLGANAYVRKPVDFVQFAEAARVLGLFWHLSSEGVPPSAEP
jgi:two-component system response regulator